jgi:hypothetical protein
MARKVFYRDTYNSKPSARLMEATGRKTLGPRANFGVVCKTRINKSDIRLKAPSSLGSWVAVSRAGGSWLSGLKNSPRVRRTLLPTFLKVSSHPHFPDLRWVSMVMVHVFLSIRLSLKDFRFAACHPLNTSSGYPIGACTQPCIRFGDLRKSTYPTT